MTNNEYIEYTGNPDITKVKKKKESLLHKKKKV